MALFDKLFEFCDNDSVYSSSSSVQSENYLDWQQADLEMGAGTPLWLNIRVSTAFSGGTSAQFKIVSHSTTTLTSGTVKYETPAIGVSTLTLGYWVLRMPLPVDIDYERYTGIVVTCVGVVTAGAIDAWIDNGSQSSYNTQVTVS